MPVWNKRADVGYEGNVFGDCCRRIDDKDGDFSFGIDFLVFLWESIRLPKVELRERDG